MPESLGTRIRERRQALGMTGRDLAEKVLGSRDRSTDISKWERNHIEPSLGNLVKLAQVLLCTTDELLDVSRLKESA